VSTKAKFFAETPKPGDNGPQFWPKALGIKLKGAPKGFRREIMPLLKTRRGPKE